MLGIKKQFIKNMIKLEVVGNTPGKLQLYIAQIKKVEDDYKKYEPYAESGLSILQGIDKLQVDYEHGIATLHYNTNLLTPQKVYRWLQVLIDVGLDYYDDLKATWDKNGDEAANVEAVWQKMQPVLVATVKKVK